MKIQAPDGSMADAVYFGEAEAFAAYAGNRERISVTYTLKSIHTREEKRFRS